MAVINFAHREITSKIVYYGAMGAGCNTNVRKLYERLAEQRRSSLHKFGPQDIDERSWYFDYIDPDQQLNGFMLRWRVYSLPGGIDLHAHRVEVLTGADAIVFVADARQDRAEPNMNSMLALEQLLGELGMELSAIPVVIQVNHTDGPSAESDAKVTFDLNPFGFPVVRASAAFSVGIDETHDETKNAVIPHIKDNMAGNPSSVNLVAVHRATQEDDGDIVREHVRAIHDDTTVTTNDTLADFAPATPSEYSSLPEGPKVEVPFQPREMAGSIPVAVMGAKLRSGQVEVELVLSRIDGEDPRRISVVLANRPTDTPPVARMPQPMLQSHGTPERITDHLPDSVAMEMPQERTSLMPIVLGSFGTVCGVLIGALFTALLLL